MKKTSTKTATTPAAAQTTTATFDPRRLAPDMRNWIPASSLEERSAFLLCTIQALKKFQILSTPNNGFQASQEVWRRIRNFDCAGTPVDKILFREQNRMRGISFLADLLTALSTARARLAELRELTQGLAEIDELFAEASGPDEAA